ncbi:hypothetical protein CR513_52192, partial [Mucuna pruriens]
MYVYLLFAFTFTSACFGIEKDEEFPSVADELHRCFGLRLEKAFLHLSRFQITMRFILEN